MFFKHYLNQNINIDVQNIYHSQASRKDLIRFVYSMSCLIDLCQLQKLTTKQSVLVNGLLCIVKLNRCIVKLSGVWGDSKKEEKYQKACCCLQSKKQQQQRLLLVDLVDCFKKEQLVIDSKQQLSRKVVDKDI